MSRSGVLSAFTRVAPWLLLAVVGVVSVGPLVTPSLPSGSDPYAISTMRALEHVATIAMEPHPMGSAANADVRSYISEELAATGLQTEHQTITSPDYFGPPGSTVEVVNVISRIGGTDGSKAVVVVGHYDSVPTTAGANDDAVAVAIMLEIARVLVDGPALANDVILLFTDGEEPAPRFGSTAFVDGHRWFGDVGFVVNLEAAGGSGPSMVIEISGSSGWLIDALAEGTADPVAFSFLTETVSAIGGIGTDFDSFSDAGIPGVHFAYLRGSPIYHTPNDSLASVDIDSVAHHGSNALDIVRLLGNSDLDDPPRTDEVTFFTLPGSLLVRYPVGWSLPLVIGACALFGAGVAFTLRDSGLEVRGIVAGSSAVLGGALASVLLVSVLWWGVTIVRTSPGVTESYAYLVTMGVLILGMWVFISRLVGNRWPRTDLLAGTLAVWLGLAAVTGVALTGMSYLFVWPAAGGSLVLLIRATTRIGGLMQKIAGVVLAAAPALMLMTPPVDTFFQIALPRPGNPDSQMVGVIGIVALLTFLAIALTASAMAGSAKDHGTP